LIAIPVVMLSLGLWRATGDWPSVMRELRNTRQIVPERVVPTTALFSRTRTPLTRTWTSGPDGQPTLAPTATDGLITPDGSLYVLNDDGDVVKAKPVDGYTLSVTNIGPYDLGRRLFAGIDATFTQGAGHIDAAAFEQHPELLPAEIPWSVHWVEVDDIHLGDLIMRADGSQTSCGADEFVLLGRSGRMMHVRPDGSVVQVVGRAGQAVVIDNLGRWDPATRRLQGMRSIFQDGAWTVSDPDSSSSGLDLFGQSGKPTELPNGFWISPGGVTVHVDRSAASADRRVHIRADQASEYLVVTSQAPLNALDGMPVSLQVRIRGVGANDLRLTLYDVVDATGRAQLHYASAPADGDWHDLTLRVRRVVFGSAGDNFSTGMYGAQAGSWFEIADLRLVVGVLP
jgi:hypothetical protein